jgi:hypothetical protein
MPILNSDEKRVEWDKALDEVISWPEMILVRWEACGLDIRLFFYFENTDFTTVRSKILGVMGDCFRRFPTHHR